MKKSYFIILVSLLLLNGCGGSTNTQDNSPTTTKVLTHYQGQSCTECHGGSDSETTFSSGATIFTSLNVQSGDVTKVASNYSLRLLLSNSNTIENYSLGNGTGNMHATFNAGITTYTAQVVDSSGNVINTSQTDSHDASRFDCNSCHTSSGLNGAPGRIVSFRYIAPTPADTNTTASGVARSFANDVLPILNDNCLSCHGNNGQFSITNNVPYAGVLPFINTTTPTSSRLLVKAAGGLYHGGGNILPTATTQYTTIRDWIAQGALDN